MTWEEVNAVLEVNYNRYKDTWEQTRWLGYINACIAGSSIKKPTDLILFAWEKEELEIVEDLRTTEERKKELLAYYTSIKNK